MVVGYRFAKMSEPHLSLLLRASLWPYCGLHEFRKSTWSQFAPGVLDRQLAALSLIRSNQAELVNEIEMSTITGTRHDLGDLHSLWRLFCAEKPAEAYWLTAVSWMNYCQCSKLAKPE